MMQMLAEIAVALIVLLGALFVLAAAIGLNRLPDVYSRMHAASKAGAVGGGMILLAIALISLDGSVAVRAIIATAFLLLTTPVSAHLLARLSHRGGYQSGVNMAIDELKSKSEQNPSP